MLSSIVYCDLLWAFHTYSLWICCIKAPLFITFRSNGEKNPRVKHYQIRQTETGEATFYLAEKYLFSTIPELIHYHQHNAAGTRAARSARVTNIVIKGMIAFHK